MVNEKFIYAKLLLLKIKKHPLFDINKKYHWPYQGSWEGNNVEIIIFENADLYNTWEDVYVITYFIDNDELVCESTICPHTKTRRSWFS